MNYNRKNILITFFFLGMLVSACEEVYNPKAINNVSPVPVIQGIITDGNFPVVSIFWSMAYKAQNQEVINGAHVTITDDLGDNETLSQDYTGSYTSTTLTGVVGRTYTLHVVLPDSSKYISTGELLRSAPQIDSLYAVPGEVNTYSYNSLNELLVQSQTGLTIYSNLHNDGDTAYYYRFNTKLITESIYNLDPGTLASRSVFQWNSGILDDPYTVENSVTKDNRQLIPQHKVGFLHYYEDVELQSPSRSPTYITAWILALNVYSVSNNVFNFYKSIGNQLNAANQIFAPVPEQAISNVTCTTNPARLVVGVFEASSHALVYKAFAWKNLTQYRSEELGSFPSWINNGSQEKIMPDWWIQL